ncbi:MAG TPA: hypothetical protein VGC93_15090, partial [Thermoanaerobaculia bacterium]
MIARWLLVLPAALLAPLGMYLLLIATSLIENEKRLWWIQLVGSAFLGYYFVVAGAKTAPVRKPLVAAALASLLTTVSLGIYVAAEALALPRDWWHIFSSAITVAAAVWGCLIIYSQEGVPPVKHTVATVV